MKKEKAKIDCANPDCTARFKPYNSRQKVCRRNACKVWLYSQNGYQRKRFATPKGEIVYISDLKEIKNNES